MNSFIIENQFDYKGYNCLCIGLHLGHRCGYVMIQEKINYQDERLSDIDCHGGLTFSGSFSEEICNDVSVKYGHYIGFDCAHWGDSKDFELIKNLNNPQTYKLLADTERMFPTDTNDTVRRLDFVESECRNIVDQLIELGIK